MKRKTALLLFSLLLTTTAIAQVKLDTIYYDKNWKGVEIKEFATYYRVAAKAKDDNFRKQFRDFYMSGELRAEGDYISINKYDDKKSKFDGELVTYYKSGNIDEKLNFEDGKLEGEYIKYDTDGSVLVHSFYRNDRLNGTHAVYSENGTVCVKTEYSDGKPVNDYYTISSSTGYTSKMRLSDDTPIYESPKLNEKKIDHKDGVAWNYYDKNGIVVAMTSRAVRDYGKYYQIELVISNNSMHSIVFEPNDVVAMYVDNEGLKRQMKVFTDEEYMKKVQRKQNTAMVFNALAEGLISSGSSYSTSTTTTTHQGSTPSGAYSGSTTSTTKTYNPAAGYQAYAIASDRIEAFDNAKLAERKEKRDEYLKRSTVYPGEVISGYINIERKKGISMTIDVDINGAVYTFPCNIIK